MCSNGRYTERGIKQAHGFCSDYWVSDPKFIVKVESSLALAAVLLEPASVLAKAWEHIEHIGKRARWEPRRALVTGAGPVGLMAALMGVQRGLEVHVQDHNEHGIKPQLARSLNASYHCEDPKGNFDIVIECTGAPALIKRVLAMKDPDSIVCLTGLSPGASDIAVDVAPFNQAMVLNNRVVFGTVNANRRHYEAAARALARADRGWLERVITRRVPVAQYQKAYEKAPGDVKTVVLFEN
jgi:threonine dehydrogenase-like Zn-dependent dehydrogenase